MVRFKHLLGVLAAVVAITSPIAAFAVQEGCTQLEINAGMCAGATTDGQSVDIRANQPGSGIPSGTSPAAGGGGSKDASGFTPDDAGLVNGLQPVTRGTYASWCNPGTPCDEANFTVSASDLVNFRPTAPVASMEPNGWMVVGLPANFIARSATETQSGTLLGYQADVRFTPVSYRWSYGDGATRTASDAGATWKALGAAEFSATATSHAYASTGAFTIRVGASFRAEYRFAGLGWHPVIGAVTAQSNPITAVAGEAKTVLVNKDCAVNPRGPGC